MACCSALLGLSATGCVVTDPVEFQQDVDQPPVIVDDPRFPNGTVITFDRADFVTPRPDEIPGSDDPKGITLKLELRVRDENTDQELEVRKVITRPFGNEPIVYTCDAADTRLVPGTLERPYNILIPDTSLVAGGCHKIDIVVSGHFDSCSNRSPNARIALQDEILTGNETDIARATYWLWEITDVLQDPGLTQRLATSCESIEYKE